MKTIFYTAWDGTQNPFTLKRRDLIKAFMDKIMEGMDPTMAMAQMLWDGFSLAGMNFRVMGLKDILQHLAKKKEEFLSQYSLARIFDQPLADLRTLLDHEAHTRTRTKGAKRSPRFEDLPPGLLEKIRSLDNFPFLNTESRHTFDEWKEREGDIRDLLEFYSTWSSSFRGTHYLDFDQALDLMRQMVALDEMERRIRSGQWTAIDPQTLKELLGDEASRDFVLLLQLPGELLRQGVIEPGTKGFDFTPRGIRLIGEMAFGDLFHMVKRDRQGSSSGNAPPSGEPEPDSSRPYTFGDRFDPDITRTMLRAVARNHAMDGRISLMPEDFFIRQREPLVVSTMVMLLDLSWSMSWENRFQAAKKVSLALDHYIRTRFPKDNFFVVGFSTSARELKARELALAVWDGGYAFTNLQAGMSLARNLIKRAGTRNNRMIIITDGQPTAYGEGVHTRVEFPTSMFGLSPHACKATLAEVRKATALGITIDIFMLDNNPVLVEFVREVARINGGKAALCRPGQLGQLLLVEEIRRREKR